MFILIDTILRDYTLSELVEILFFLSLSCMFLSDLLYGICYVLLSG